MYICLLFHVARIPQAYVYIRILLPFWIRKRDCKRHLQRSLHARLSCNPDPRTMLGGMQGTRAQAMIRRYLDFEKARGRIILSVLQYKDASWPLLPLSRRPKGRNSFRRILIRLCCLLGTSQAVDVECSFSLLSIHFLFWDCRFFCRMLL